MKNEAEIWLDTCYSKKPASWLSHGSLFSPVGTGRLLCPSSRNFSFPLWDYWGFIIKKVLIYLIELGLVLHQDLFSPLMNLNNRKQHRYHCEITYLGSSVLLLIDPNQRHLSYKLLRDSLNNTSFRCTVDSPILLNPRIAMNNHLFLFLRLLMMKVWWVGGLFRPIVVFIFSLGRYFCLFCFFNKLRKLYMFQIIKRKIEIPFFLNYLFQWSKYCKLALKSSDHRTPWLSQTFFKV